MTTEPDYATDLLAFNAKFQPYSEQGRRIDVLPHHRRVDERMMVFDRRTGLLLPRIIIEGALKKSSKTMRAGQKVNWWAMCHGPTEINCFANDFDQSQGRVFATAAALCERNGWVKARFCKVLSNEIRFKNGSVVRALASDFKGSAGSRATLNVFDELWGFTEERAERLFEEATPIPTAENAWILIVTTAGFTGESRLLERLYRQGLQGERIDDELPIYRNGRLFMYWDHVARCPWHTPEYLAEQRASLRSNTYLRLWENRWVSSEARFVDADAYDRCVDLSLRPVLADAELPIYIGIDAGVKSDTSAVVAVAWDGRKLRLITHRVWKPTPGQPLDLTVIEDFVRQLHRDFDLQVAVADPWQLYKTIGDLRADGIEIREQPFTPASTSLMTQSLYDVIVGGNLRLYANDEVRTAILNAAVVESPKGLKLAKPTASRKIDLCIACALAVQAALAAGPDSVLPLMLAGGERWREWQNRAPLPPQPSDETDDEDEEVIEASDEEMLDRPDAAEWEPVPDAVLPRMERRRRHADRVVEIATTTGWFPGDEA